MTSYALHITETNGEELSKSKASHRDQRAQELEIVLNAALDIIIIIIQT